jgi:hypothetical protein
MEWRSDEKNLSNGGCHEGDAVASADGKRYAAISIPDRNLEHIGHLHEWAKREERALC